MKIREIIDIIEQFAPLEDEDDWDNSGWQIEPFEEETNKILCALDVNENTVEQAVQSGCGLILSHHPVFFSPIKSITPSFITKAIQHKIAVYSAHTNLDKAKGGVNECFAELCGFPDIEYLMDFVKYKKTDKPEDMKALIERLKIVFGISQLKIVNLNKAQFNSVAFCSGAGDEFIEILDESGIDVYITADIKYHRAQAAKRMTIIDVGHFNSERCAVQLFKKILSGCPVEIVEAKEKDVFEYI